MVCGISALVYISLQILKFFPSLCGQHLTLVHVFETMSGILTTLKILEGLELTHIRICTESVVHRKHSRLESVTTVGFKKHFLNVINYYKV